MNEQIISNRKIENSDEKIIWKIFIVDDDENVYNTTLKALKDVVYKNINLKYFYFESANKVIAELKKLDSDDPDVAVIFLDAVMEDNGFDVIKYLRNEVKNNMTQIVLRTGQAGKTIINNPKEIALEYEINDFIDKLEQSLNRLQTSLINSLRMFQYLKELHEKNNELKNLYFKFIADFSISQKKITNGSSDIVKLIKDIFCQLKAIYSKSEIEIGKDAIDALAEIKNINFKSIFLIINNIIINSNKNKIGKIELEKSLEIIYNKMIWQENEIWLENLYNGLIRKNFIKKIELEIFKNHFTDTIIPDQPIDWTLTQNDLLYLFFELENCNCLDINFSKIKFKELVNHFIIEGNLINYNSIRSAGSSNEEKKTVPNQKSAEGYSTEKTWIGKNPNKEAISEIIVDLEG